MGWWERQQTLHGQDLIFQVRSGGDEQMKKWKKWKKKMKLKFEFDLEVEQGMVRRSHNPQRSGIGRLEFAECALTNELDGISGRWWRRW